MSSTPPLSATAKPTPPSGKTPQGRIGDLLLALAVAVGLTLIIGLLLRMKVLPRGIIFQWDWPPRDHLIAPGRAAVAAVGTLLLAALVAFDRVRDGQRPTRAMCALLLALLIVLSALTMGALAFSDEQFWLTGTESVLSHLSMGYYGAAVSPVSARELFATQVERSRDLQAPDRMRTHPPGPILALRSARAVLLASPSLLAFIEQRVRLAGFANAIPADAMQLLTRAPVTQLDLLVALPAGLLVTLPAVLVCLPVFGLGVLLSDRRTGLLAATLSLAISSLLAFVPSIDAVPALLAMTLLYLWALALISGSRLAYVGCGLAGAAALLWTYGLAVMVVPMAVLGIVLWRQGRIAGGRRRAATGLVLTLAAFAAVYAALFLWSGYNVAAAMTASLAAHREVTLHAQRGYWEWLPGNAYDIILFAGPALTLLWLWTLLAHRRGDDPLRNGVAVGWAAAALLIFLLLSGSTRGEVGRIWVFVMPLMIFPVAWQIGRFRGSALLGAAAAFIIAQVGFAVFLTSFVALVRPY